MHEEHLGSEMPPRGDLSYRRSLYFKVRQYACISGKKFGLDSLGTGPIGPRSNVHMINRCTKEIDMSPEAFVTADEIAAHLKTTRRQVLELTRKGVLPAHPLCLGSRRKIWRYKLSEVDQTIALWTKPTMGDRAVVNLTPPEGTISVGSPRSRKGQSNG